MHVHQATPAAFTRSRHRAGILFGLLALAFTGTGCFPSLLADVPPPGLELRNAPAGRRCPDLTGAYVNATVIDRSPGALPRQRTLEPRGRHLAAFFAGVPEPERIATVALTHPSPGSLAVNLVEPDGRSTQILLRESLDYRCNGRELVVDRSPLLRRRDGGSLRFGRTPSGCLIEHTRYRGWLVVLLGLPIAEDSVEEWNLFCGLAPEPAR